MQIHRDTECLILRRFEETDYPDVWQYKTDPVVCRFLGETPAEELVQQFLEQQQNIELAVEGQWNYFAVELKVEKKVIGDVVIKVVSQKNRVGEIGWFLNSAYHGRGLATEAARALLDLGFTTYDLHRLVARCDIDNTRSHRLMERIGMQREGLFKEAMFLRGQWRDEYRYAILDHQWR